MIGRESDRGGRNGKRGCLRLSRIEGLLLSLHTGWPRCSWIRHSPVCIRVCGQQHSCESNGAWGRENTQGFSGCLCWWGSHKAQHFDVIRTTLEPSTWPVGVHMLPLLLFLWSHSSEFKLWWRAYRFQVESTWSSPSSSSRHFSGNVAAAHTHEIYII